MEINFENRKFKSLKNANNGEVSEDTLFHYHQNGQIVSATYQGGSIVQGQLIGKIFSDYHLEFAYQHINTNYEIMTGVCKSYPELDDSGKIVLKEYWRWTCKDNSIGESIIIEI